MRRTFVVVGQTATASGDFLVDDVPGTSGRLDVLLRCVRAALLVSHGLRRDARLFLVLGGGQGAPRTVRIDGAEAKFVRPDERSLAVLVKKMLSQPTAGDEDGFIESRHGIAVARGGLDAVLGALGAGSTFVLEQGATDVRDVPDLSPDPVFFVGDHLGFEAATRARLAAAGATPVGLGPISVHAEDAIAIVSNELDRRDARVAGRAGGSGT